MEQWEREDAGHLLALPVAEDAEKAVISAILQEPRKLIPDAVSSIDKAAFMVPAHAIIYEVIALMPTRGIPIDPVTVQSELLSRGDMAEIGGPTAIVDLMSHADPDHYEFYKDIVLRKYAVRQTVIACKNAIDLVEYDDSDPQGILSGLSKSLSEIDITGTKNAHGLPPILAGTQIEEEDVVLPPEIIEGILHQGAKMVLGGGSKSFKTWCLADLAICIATGLPWMGRQVPDPGPVLFCNLEVLDPFFRFRLKEIAKAKGIPLPENLHVWNLRGHCNDHSALLPQMIDVLGDSQYRAIMLDPTYKLMSGSENAQEEVAALMDSIEKLGERTGASPIYASHFAKGSAANKAAIDRISGSGVFARDPDAIITLTPHEEDSCFVMDSILRNCPPIDPVGVRWEFPLMTIDPDLDPEELKGKDGGGGANKKEALPPAKVKEILLMNGGTMKKGELRQELRDKGASKRSADESIEAAVAEGVIDQTGTDRHPAYVLPLKMEKANGN